VSGCSGWPIVVPLPFIAGDLPIRESVAASLVIDTANAAAAALVYTQRGQARPPVAIDLGGWVLGPALVGVVLAIVFLDRFSDLLRGLAPWVVVVVGVGLVVRSRHMSGEDAQVGLFSAHLGSARLGWSRALAALCGLAMGVVGMGGAFTLALVLMFIRGLTTVSSVATGLLITAGALPLLLVAHLAFLESWLPVGAALLPVAACSALAAAAGARHAGHLPERRRAFTVGACVIVAGLAATGLTEGLPGGGLPG
jgi:uncharacterized membrane protein YfcA